MTVWEMAISRLRAIGYRFVLDGENLRYTFQGKHPPSPGQIIPLIEVLTAHKEEIVNNPHFLIDQTLREINKAWTPGALEWMKRTRPNDFEKMVALEREINRIATTKNINELVEVLRSYKDMALGVAETFKTPKSKTKNLFPWGSEDS